MTDHDTTQAHECFMNIGATVAAKTKPTELVKPTDRPFHHPSRHAQAAAMFRVSLGENRSDAHLSQTLAMRLGIVCTIPLGCIGFSARATGLSRDGRNGRDQGEKLRNVMAVRAGQNRRQRHPVSASNHMMLGAPFTPVCRVRAGFFAPPTARTEPLSTTDRDQSIWSAARSFARKTRWMVCQTPAACQSRSRRQQVIPLPQPISWGRYSHGIPVLRTKRIPISAWRFPRGLRPGNRLRRGFGAGSNGSMIFHNPSDKIGFAMIAPPCAFMTSAIVNRFIQSFC